MKEGGLHIVTCVYMIANLPIELTFDQNASCDPFHLDAVISIP